jgi:hypothetical protein
MAELRYLFGAHLSDGPGGEIREIFQNPEDLSPFSPGKNCFYDLLEHDAEGNTVPHQKDGIVEPRPDIEIFQLEGDGHKYVVDLRDGHFEIDGLPFYVETPPGPLRLVYFRRVRKHFTRSMGGDEASALIREEVEYHMGWETEDKSSRQTIILI